jgi:hypothetical protein
MKNIFMWGPAGFVAASADYLLRGYAFHAALVYQVIAIIEMESTVSGESLEKLCNHARDTDLVNHLQLPDYASVKYGIAIGFSYDPEKVLTEEPGTPPLIKVYTREELLENERS